MTSDPTCGRLMRAALSSGLGSAGGVREPLLLGLPVGFYSTQKVLFCALGPLDASQVRIASCMQMVSHRSERVTELGA